MAEASSKPSVADVSDHTREVASRQPAGAASCRGGSAGSGSYHGVAGPGRDNCCARQLGVDRARQGVQGLVGYLESKSSVLAVAAGGVLCAFCCLVDALPGQCLRRRPRAYPLVAAVFRTNGYCVNAVQLHVNAADLLVRRGVDRDDSR